MNTKNVQDMMEKMVLQACHAEDESGTYPFAAVRTG